MLIIISLFYFILNGLIGLYDFSFYRIPNLFLGVLLVLYALYAPLYLPIEDILRDVGVFLIILAASFGLYFLKFIGAGDAKYFAVASLWVGSLNVIGFLLTTAIAGGILALIYLGLKDQMARLSDLLWKQIQIMEKNYPFLEKIWMWSEKHAEKGKRHNVSNRVIPYGLAIAAGAIITFYKHPLG